jgi:hypothetical protein
LLLAERGKKKEEHACIWMIGYGGVVGDELISSSSMSWSYDTFHHH